MPSLLFALMAAWLGYLPVVVSSADAQEASPTMLSLVEKDNDRTIDIRLGEIVRITLPENASTGYRWTIDHYDKEFIAALEPEPRYSANAIGSGGEITFIFKGEKIGSGEIALKHWRPWEGDSSVTSRFRLWLHVQP